MFTRLWMRRREDDGVALMMAVALTAMDASFVNGAVIPVDGGMTAVSR